MCGSSATASASACCPQRIVLNVRVTGVTVTTVVAVTAAVLAVSTVNVVVEPDVLIAVILALESIPVPAILSPTSARVAITAEEATPKVKPASVPATVTSVVVRVDWSAPSLALARREDST
jgi:hypothetical protein